jgi:hypothetical protein
MKWVAVIFCFAAPKFFLIQSSGLTEPLFTLFLVSIIYLFKKNKLVSALLLLSFLPFVRSEGWIIIPIVTLYLINQKKAKWSPIILIGTLVYGLIGLFHYHDFLWMFHQNPYSGVEAKYGSGDWLHFVNQLPYVVGFPLFGLFVLGLFDGFWRTMNKRIDYLEFFLIYGITIGYVMAHTIFWAEGLFHSFGLNRVLIVLIPLIAFIAYRGLERLICAFSFVNSKLLQYAIISLVIIFPFTNNNAGFNLPNSYELEPGQKLAYDVKHFTDSAFGALPIYYGNCYLPMIYDLNMDQENQAYHINLLKEGPPIHNALILWDSYFAVTDQGVLNVDLKKNRHLRFVKKFECTSCRQPYSIEVYHSLPK